MTGPEQRPLAWVSKRDGRLVPFDPDEISRDLFAASQRLGRPDAFLARELTDGVLHFLNAEIDSGPACTAQIAETVVKVVRELGQAALSQAFLQSLRGRTSPTRASAPIPEGLPWSAIHPIVEAGLQAPQLAWQLGRECLRHYSLRAVFGPDLVAAHSDRIITLGNLEAPLELAGLHVPLGEPSLDVILEARGSVGQFVALDGLEYALAAHNETPPAVAGRLRDALLQAGLSAVVNVNCAIPPTWAGQVADGPLFGSQGNTSADPTALSGPLVDALLEAGTASGGELSPFEPGQVRIDWHLAARNFEAEAAGRLARIVRWALDGAPVTFVMDRAGRPVALAEGIDRAHPALLMTVGLHLPVLADQAGVQRNPAVFLRKLGSLARMAVSAGVQKREFLRRHLDKRQSLARGFLLDRARLVVVPVGLDAAVRSMLGSGLCGSQEALDFAQQIVDHLRAAIKQDGASRHLESCLDGPNAFVLDGRTAPESAAGLTAWDAAAPALEQFRAAEALQCELAIATAAIQFPAESPATVSGACQLLHHAWRKSGIVRLRFVRGGAAQGPLAGEW